MELKEARERIDAVDGILLDAFLKRMALSREIGGIKKDLGLPSEDPAREAEVLKRVAEKSGDLAPYAEELYRCLFTLSRDYQKRGLQSSLSLQSV